MVHELPNPESKAGCSTLMGGQTFPVEIAWSSTECEHGDQQHQQQT